MFTTSTPSNPVLPATTMSSSSVHVVPPTSSHTHTIILLHGRGSSATQFFSEFFESQASDNRFLPQIFPDYRWVFLCAALRYTESEEEEDYQWFDMESVQKPCYDPEGIQIAGMQESVVFVGGVIKEEAAEVGGFDKVFLGGISQGCATAITALLTVGEPMAGFIGFCGWCPFSETGSDGSSSDMSALLEWLQARLLPAEKLVETATVSSALRTPVLLEHAKDDGVVPVALGQDLHSKLASLGAKMQWREYEDGDHWINEPKGIDDMVKFVFAKVSPSQEVL